MTAGGWYNFTLEALLFLVLVCGTTSAMPCIMLLNASAKLFPARIKEVSLQISQNCGVMCIVSFITHSADTQHILNDARSESLPPHIARHAARRSGMTVMRRLVAG